MGLSFHSRRLSLCHVHQHHVGRRVLYGPLYSSLCYGYVLVLAAVSQPKADCFIGGAVQAHHDCVVPQLCGGMGLLYCVLSRNPLSYVTKSISSAVRSVVYAEELLWDARCHQRRVVNYVADFEYDCGQVAGRRSTTTTAALRFPLCHEVLSLSPTPPHKSSLWLSEKRFCVFVSQRIPHLYFMALTHACSSSRNEWVVVLFS